MPVSRALALAVAGAALGLLEALIVGALDGSLFLSFTEWHRFAWAAVLGNMALTLVVGLVGALGATVLGLSRHAATLTGVVALPLLAWAGTLLTEGRRVRDLPYRWVLVGMGAALGAGILAQGVRWALPRLSVTRSGIRLASGMLLLAGVCLVVDSQVLRRLYPAFHVGLTVVAVGLAVLASQAFVLPFARSQYRGRARIGLIAACVLAPVVVLSAFRSPNLRYVIRDAAPVLGKLLPLLPGTEAPRVPLPKQVQALAHVAGGAGVDLRGRDILLITVDALRADRLAAYGGTGLTPNMDALAKRGALFERAYTTTPHTSYAMSSLMTGKYMREVLALSGGQGEHATLAETVRRYGYRTAAFYPPALFFVDAAHFTGLRDRHFGFEYAKAMFAPAAHRVDQVAEYLDVVEEGHPLFLWVHFFEPHEPYQPPMEFARGSSPEQRYDGEVAATDAAIGRLVELVEQRRGHDVVVVLTADHGEEFGDHGGLRHGTTLFEEQVRVPLVIAAEGSIPPGRVSVPTDNVDVATTLLGALGMPPEARMRGDDLSGVLAGETPDETPLAFASVGDEQMAVDGRFKLICRAGRDCRLFDLIQDPEERRNVAQEHAERVQRLRGQLARFAASIPEHEMLALEGTAFPEALSRARLHDPTAAPELLPLLGDDREAIRAEAAAALAALRYQPALPVLSNMRLSDPAPRVRIEAALATLSLGDVQAQDQVALALGDGALGPDLRRRAAFALGERGRAEAVPLLAAAANDHELAENLRVEAIERLTRFSGEQVEQALSEAMADVRLRPHAAHALGEVGGQVAARVLQEALETERYPEARTAEAAALIDLGHPAAGKLLARFLGMESSVPGGVELLLSLPRNRRGGALGGRLADLARIRTGAFECSSEGCVPGAGAALRVDRLVRGRRPQQWVLSYEAQPGAVLSVGEWSRPLAAGTGQVSLPLSSDGEGVPVSGTAVHLRSLVVVPRSGEIPPPAPEPWDAGLAE